MALGNVLVIRPGALGDAVLTLPALGALELAGASNLTVLGTPASWRFLGELCFIQIVDFASTSWLGLFADGAQLSKEAIAILENTQTVILYLSGDTSAIQRKLLAHGVTRILAIEPPVASNSFVAKTNFQCSEIDWASLSPRHAARRLLDPLVHCDAQIDFTETPLNRERFEALKWLDTTSDELVAAWDEVEPPVNFFVVHPGSGGRKKCWPAKRFAELTARVSRHFNRHAIVFFGPADADMRREFEAAMPGDIRWQCFENRPLRDVVSFIKLSGVFIGNDSGLSHVAARFAPVLSIFGPTDPEVWAPIGQRVHVVQAPGGDLNTLDVDTVFDALLPLISNSWKPSTP